jgi:carboxyl-terminal processing protease
MKFSMRNMMFVSLGLILGFTLTIGQGVLAEKENGKAEPLPLDELRTFTEVFGKIKSDYVEPTEDSTLLENAIRGMLTGLDPHSTYLDPEAYKELQVGTSGEFGGLGIEVGMEDGFVKVISPIDDTPAQRAGMQTGDLIIRIDETPVKGLSLNEAVKLMRGKPGTKILLTVVREGVDRPLKVSITRAIIKVNSVKSRMLEPDFGYVRITQFQANTGESLINAVSDLKKENEGNLKGLVLDLRNNPGGVLNAAVAVSDAFLEDGLIVYTEGRINDSEMKFKATPTDIIKGAPMVVLVNGGSASASEIVSGALQDHKRAIIMGSTTFGKGSVQTILPMQNGAALKLTTARYYTPSGRSIQAQGIVPDIPLENMKLAESDVSPFEPIKEANLSRHLENENGDAEETDKESDAKADEKKDEALAKKDYQLYEALNLLKGLEILQR